MLVRAGAMLPAEPVAVLAGVMFMRLSNGLARGTRRRARERLSRT